MKTKQRIFNTSLRLFALNGFENVSLRTIADEVGIKAASIYNHYKSKDMLLCECYNFFVKNRNSARLSKEDYTQILLKGSRREVTGTLYFRFPEDILDNMTYSLLVIFARVYIDPTARKIYSDEVNDALRYLSDLLKEGIALGRFDDFDTLPVALTVLSTRLFAAQSIALAPSERIFWHGEEVDTFGDFIYRIIPFKY